VLLSAALRSSELTCISDKEYYEKLAYKTFPMITPRMTKITVGLCEWTVAEVTPTQVKRNVFLLGNAWATCTFLPIAEKECAKPIVGGLTMTVQALQYQFALPKGIHEYDEYESAEEEEDQEAVTASTDNKKSSSASSKAATASTPAAAAKQSATRAAVAVAAVAPAKKAVASPAAAKGANTTATVMASTTAAGKVTSSSSSKVKGKYLMDVELQNVFLGLITGAFGPKKAHKYK
jgi:hypothetical protein